MAKSEPRPVCPECLVAVDPREAAVLHTLDQAKSPWVISPERLMGVYCCSDHLLDAYLRGYPSRNARRRKIKKTTRGRS